MDRLLIIGYVWPEPNSSAAGARMLQLIEFFRAEKYAVSFATTASGTSNMVDLAEMGVQTETIQLNSSSFDVFIKNLNPSIVLFDRFMMEEQFGWRVSKICPDALKILDTEDLHFLRNLREEVFRKKIPAENAFFGSDMAKREIASIYRCDLSLIISETELELLVNQYNVPKNLLFYLPFMLKSISKENIKDLPSFEERSHFVSIGNFRHAPNWDAVLNLKEHIWPKINKTLPEAELHIYGAYHSKNVFDLHDPKNGF
ncbi:MAG TPA: glycosyltransferase, partial [Salinimicrobium sp.]|nr:glycosyltransferase [Salinimicrobium sp.]